VLDNAAQARERKIRCSRGWTFQFTGILILIYSGQEFSLDPFNLGVADIVLFLTLYWLYSICICLPGFSKEYFRENSTA
jgi:hypothetical protein